ncbi:hypothetical protein A6C57_00265 [Fibrella sp. ES10-3-2-2]|nr:hypothetical protein A6C57_00265 [Fibrella sp. ES10-3-2-2]
MFKRLKLGPVHLFLLVVALALTIMVWKGCQPKPETVIVVEPLTPPASVTSEPTDAEVEAMKRLQHHEEANRKRHD